MFKGFHSQESRQSISEGKVREVVKSINATYAIDKSSCAPHRTASPQHSRPASVCDSTTDEHSPNCNGLDKIAHEFHHTEEKYLAQLISLLTLAARLDEHGYKLEILKDIRCLVHLHGQILSEMARMVKAKEFASIYRVFLGDVFAHFKMYAMILDQINSQLEKYLELKKEDPKLNKLVNTLVNKDGKTDVLILQDIPMRIVRYSLLLDSLISKLPPEHLMEAKEAKRRIGELCFNANNHVRSMTVKRQLNELRNGGRIVHHPPGENATFLKHCDSATFALKGSKKSHCEVFLFSDRLYIAPNKSDTVLDWKVEDLLMVQDNPSEGSTHFLRLMFHADKAFIPSSQPMKVYGSEVDCSEEFVDLNFGSNDEMMAWKSCILEARKGIQQQRRDSTISTKSSPNPFSAPETPPPLPRRPPRRSVPGELPNGNTNGHTNEDRSPYSPAPSPTSRGAIHCCASCSKSLQSFSVRRVCSFCDKVICCNCSFIKETVYVSASALSGEDYQKVPRICAVCIKDLRHIQ